MPFQVLPKESAARADSAAKLLLDHLTEQQARLELEEAVAFYNFPLFREDDQLLVAELVLISPHHGVILISTSFGTGAEAAAKRLEGAFSQIFSRLVRYPKLRSGRASLLMAVDAFAWLPDGVPTNELKVGLPSIDAYLTQNRKDALAPDVFEELLSVLDGSKALIRPRERKLDAFPPKSRIATIARLEDEIRKFDRDQRVAYMTEVYGPQRIRGLAGSGKTVVLALKAALTAVRNPDARIAVTFYTKSLYQHIKQLITRFYRLHEDKDPDWSKLQVLHAWGGATLDGLYYATARRFGHQPLTFMQAAAINRQKPFATACARLLADPTVKSAYDYVFVDEAQDFPPEFMQLALRLAVDEKMVIAYDVFQTIFDVDVPTAATLFGTPESAEGLVFDEDIILHKCYRNPREIMVCAHAVGFGIYGSKIVQMLESKDHWQDFGYEVKGELAADKLVEIERPRENSPSSISDSDGIEDILSVKIFESYREELAHVAERIENEIRTQGISPEDILVICADDRNASGYLSALRGRLAELNINSNNLQDDSFSLKDFQREGAVTLSTIYKAKGNEAYSVYLVGIDALFYAATPRSRNRAFTAMTRAKGWLYVTGVGHAARVFADEIANAKKNFPFLRFKYPNPQQLVYMKRDLILVDPEEADEELSKLGAGLEPEDFERLLKRKLREVQARTRRPQKR